MMPRLVLVAFLLCGVVVAVTAQATNTSFVNFEAAQTSPIRLSADGLRLFAVNTADARLSVFDLADPSLPRLIAEIPVGLEPVSVNARTSDEAWVVNQVSDSVSIVSVSRGIVTDTLQVKDEPADIVFARGQAFVTAARSNQVHVFDVITRREVKRIDLFGGHPRALAVSLDGRRVYAAFALSGNHTTGLISPLAPPQSPPTNPALPPPPTVSRIIDANDPLWRLLLGFRMPDNDVAVIDARGLTVTSYVTGVGTLNLGIAVRPTTGELYVSNTDARNLVFFEPNVRGHFVDNRITRIRTTGQAIPIDLNPGIDYSVLPNPAALAGALAQPTALVFDGNGERLYVAAFGTDRVARLDSNGAVQSVIEVGPAKGAQVDSRTKRGPRGLALHDAAARLYVLNRISNTISVIDTTSDSVLTEIPVGSFDPTPPIIRQGRGFLYDAKLSGNGTGSCAACHLDAEMDKLSWDLGNPAGEMQTVVSLGREFELHPMKGPMFTQTLRGLEDLQPLHWRGDRADFKAFNPAFDALMGGTPLSDADMALFTAFIKTVRFQPNPYQNLDRTLPTTAVNGGNPQAGRELFMNMSVVGFGQLTCNACHKADPGPGTTRAIVTSPAFEQPMKIPHLRNVYQKLGFTRDSQSSIDGFGLSSDGTVSTGEELIAGAFPELRDMPVVLRHLAAFLMTFDTGTAPAVGYSRTLTPANANDEQAGSDWTLLEEQAASGNIALIVKGTIGGNRRGLVYVPALGKYATDSALDGPFTRSELTQFVLSQGDTLTLMGVPPGTGPRMGVDRDADGVLDADEGAARAF